MRFKCFWLFLFSVMLNVPILAQDQPLTDIERHRLMESTLKVSDAPLSEVHKLPTSTDEVALVSSELITEQDLGLIYGKTTKDVYINDSIDTFCSLGYKKKYQKKN